jgi:hypothetical protein
MLQNLDTSVPLDPMRSINKPFGLCDNELRQQRSPLKDPFNVPANISAALAVPSVESIHTEKHLTAKAAYETISASQVPLLLTPDQTTRLLQILGLWCSTMCKDAISCQKSVSYTQSHPELLFLSLNYSRIRFKLYYLWCLPMMVLANILTYSSVTH